MCHEQGENELNQRPYRDWTRRDIDARIQKHGDERAHLMSLAQKNDEERKSHDDSLWVDQTVETKKLFGRIERHVERVKIKEDMSHMARSMQLISFSKSLSEERIVLAQDVQVLEFELHIRDTPELVEQFGAGAD